MHFNILWFKDSYHLFLCTIFYICSYFSIYFSVYFCFHRQFFFIVLHLILCFPLMLGCCNKGNSPLGDLYSYLMRPVCVAPWCPGGWCSAGEGSPVPPAAASYRSAPGGEQTVKYSVTSKAFFYMTFMLKFLISQNQLTSDSVIIDFLTNLSSSSSWHLY